MIVLASASPQRSAILKLLAVDFRVQVSGAAETHDGAPTQVASSNALSKALAVAAGLPKGELVLGSDTVIAAGSQAVGKPRDLAEARSMLSRWSGSSHLVISGAAVVRAPDEVVFCGADSTEVHFRQLTDSDIDWYLQTGEWEGRAGAYAIQERGSLLVRKIDGDWWNVVGLPVSKLMQEVPWLLQSPATDVSL